MKQLAAIGLALAGLSANPALGATFSLTLNANPDGRWYEYFSDVYAEIGRPFNGSQVPDGFFQIGAPGNPQIGGGFDAFPTEGLFANVGSVTFDTAGYGGVGAFNAPITALTADFQPYIAQDATFLGPGYDYTTAFSGVAGTVALFNGAVTGINLTSTIAFTYPDIGFGPFVSTGAFNIAGGSFVLNADAPGGIGDPRYRWDFAGSVANLAPVPEPSALAMLLAGMGLVGTLAQRRRA